MGQYMSKPWWGTTAPAPATPAQATTTATSSSSPAAEPPVVKDAHLPMLEDSVRAAASVHVDSLATPEGREAFRAIVREYGFAIVDGVLPPPDVATAESLWSADLRGIVRKVDPKAAPSVEGEAGAPTAKRAFRLPAASSSDDDDGKEKPSVFADMIEGDEARTFPTDRVSLGRVFVTECGLTQGRMPWFVRRHENVVSVFAALHELGPKMKADPRALCVGTDAIFYSAHGLADDEDAAALEDNLWPHIDLNEDMLPHGRWSTFQSAVYVWPATERTKSTVILPRGNSAAAHAKYLADSPTGGSHYRPVRSRHFGAFAQEARRVPVPAGGMVVWSTDTIHQGWSHGSRLAVPVCMEPRWRRPEEALARKRSAVRRGLTTTHWASIGLVHGFQRDPLPVDRGRYELIHCAQKHASRRPAGAPDDAELSDSDLEIDPEIDRYL